MSPSPFVVVDHDPVDLVDCTTAAFLTNLTGESVILQPDHVEGDVDSVPFLPRPRAAMGDKARRILGSIVVPVDHLRYYGSGTVQWETARGTEERFAFIADIGESFRLRAQVADRVYERTRKTLKRRRDSALRRTRVMPPTDELWDAVHGLDPVGNATARALMIAEFDRRDAKKDDDGERLVRSRTKIGQEERVARRVGLARDHLDDTLELGRSGAGAAKRLTAGLADAVAVGILLRSGGRSLPFREFRKRVRADESGEAAELRAQVRREHKARAPKSGARGLVVSALAALRFHLEGDKTVFLGRGDVDGFEVLHAIELLEVKGVI